MSNYLTIPGFESLTRQQLLDMSVAHVLKNGKASTQYVGKVQKCSYRGIGCAAAPFLTKEGRNKGESSGWSALVHREGIAPNHECLFISGLQRCHDNSALLHGVGVDDALFLKSYKICVIKFAEMYKLQVQAGVMS